MSTRLRLGVNTLFYLPGEVGGSETYLRETLRALTQRPEPPQLVFFTNAENHDLLQKEFPEAEFHPLGIAATNRGQRIWSEQTALPRLIRRARLDVLWSPGYTAPALTGVPQVVSILDMQYKRFPQDVTWLAARTMDVLYPLAARRSVAIVTISEFAKTEITRYLRVPPDKITVTLLGAGADYGATSGLPPESVRGAPYLLCVAHTYPHKNVAMQVRAFTRLADRIPHRLVLVGKARLGEPEVAAALRQAPAARIVRLSDVAAADMAALYQCADWLVFPSLYEGFGLPVLEAMRAGTPVLTTREAAIPEVGGDAVVYADGRNEEAWAKTLRTVLTWPREMRLRLTVAAKQRAAQFTWAASADTLWTVLNQAARKG